GLVDGYAAAAVADPGAVLSGPVTYLREGTGRLDVEQLPELIDPHPARPNLPAGATRRATAAEHDLFWSLTFAATAATWRGILATFGGFHEGYAGYGAEDTDFGAQLLAHDVALTWVGGAHALHQWHPVSSPPVEHLDDILRNGALFRDRHGRWPMEGWLERFEEMGLVRRDGDEWSKA
uniref:glycosyltransferase family 2 protein n=1 Tax=uncultured Corynebacterium sp. TaxID=159447 RepID=UPI00345C94E1